MNLGELMVNKKNNFDLIRLLAAILVIFSHSFPLKGISFEPFGWLTGSMSFGELAVAVFFVISGLLITKSWFDAPKAGTYIRKRSLRIVPAFAVVIFAMAFIVGPLFTKLPFNQYMTDPGTYTYLKNVLMFNMRDSLPGVFSDNPFPNAINGSLWTLPVEVFMYFIVLVFGMAKLLNKKSLQVAWLSFLFILYAQLSIRPRFSMASFLTLPLLPMLKLAIFFFIGSAAYLFREHIQYSNRFFIASMLVTIGAMRTPFFTPVCFLTIPYIVFYLAYVPVPDSLNVRKYGDFSYGIYIYAFPVQQAVIRMLGRNLPSYWFFLISFAITLPFAVLSWHLIEKPFIRMKSRLSVSQKQRNDAGTERASA